MPQSITVPTPRPRLPASIALAMIAALGACGDPESTGASPTKAGTAVPRARLVDLAELEAAVKRNLQRGALVTMWATW